MAGRKKVTEETMTTEEMMETEAQALEGAEKLSDGDAAADGNDMDLNKLLESMDQEPEEPGVQGGASRQDCRLWDAGTFRGGDIWGGSRNGWHWHRGG